MTNDLCPHRPPTTIFNTIWRDDPTVAAAILGYCDGKLGEPPNPPCVGKEEYMREYIVGVTKRNA